MHFQIVLSFLLASASATPLPRWILSGNIEPVRRDTKDVVSSSAAVLIVNDNDGIGNGTDKYTQYEGNGSIAEGWPSYSQWVSFSDMWENNKPIIAQSCTQFNQENPSKDEIDDLHAAIEQVAGETFVDHRFILAIIMQESKGCVRVPTTNSGVSNPGLMQDHNGIGTCYDINPCRKSTIVQMIQDGTASDYGLASLLNEYITSVLAGGDIAQAYYEAARAYNSGSVAPSGMLQDGGSTPCYASDIANRLVGWVNAENKCTSQS